MAKSFLTDEIVEAVQAHCYSVPTERWTPYNLVLPALKIAAPGLIANELERLAQQVHDDGALTTYTALDVEMLLKSRAAEIRTRGAA